MVIWKLSIHYSILNMDNGTVMTVFQDIIKSYERPILKKGKSGVST